MCIEIVGVIQALRSQGKSLDFELIYLCLSWVWPEDICTVKASFNAHTAQAFADFPERPCYAEPTTGPEQLPQDEKDYPWHMLRKPDYFKIASSQACSSDPFCWVTEVPKCR